MSKRGSLKPDFNLEFVDNGIIIRDGTQVTVRRLPMEGPELILTTFWAKVGKYDLILRPTAARRTSPTRQELKDKGFLS